LFQLIRRVIMDIEEAYYEIPDFWNEGCLGPIDIERIKITSKFIPDDVRTILDVGCGNGLFLNYLQENHKNYSRLHGTDRSATALKYVNTQKTKSNINSLPFFDNEFDLVTSLEVIEHLPLAVYNMGLKEMARVSKKYILISVPNSQILENSLIQCPLCKSKFNPDYHMRSFNKEKMIGLFNTWGFKCTRLEFVSQYKELLCLSKIYSIISHKSNPYLMAIPCPVCGFSVAGLKNDSKNTKIQKFQNILQKFWPQKQKHRWIIGLYEKQ